MEPVPSLPIIKNAARRIKPYIHTTPVMRSDGIDAIVGASLYFKCENFQRVGAFKMRGATNAVFSLTDEEAAAGVATHSSGNHAQALALAAKLRGLSAHIVMPENAPAVKIAAVKAYDGRITFCPPTLNDREQTLAAIVDRTGATYIPPYNDYRIIAGQATAAMELLERVPDLDMIITPVGGGGLLSGTALTAHYHERKIDVFGAEPSGADDARQSFLAGKLIPVKDPDTIADGLRTSLGTKTFPIIKSYVQNIHTADDDQILEAMRLVWERMKIIIEPSAAVPLAILLNEQLNISGKKAGIILSGGNVDLDRLPW